MCESLTPCFLVVFFYFLWPDLEVLPGQDKGCIIDNLLADIRKGYRFKRTTAQPQRPSKIHGEDCGAL